MAAGVSFLELTEKEAFHHAEEVENGESCNESSRSDNSISTRSHHAIARTFGGRMRRVFLLAVPICLAGAAVIIGVAQHRQITEPQEGNNMLATTKLLGKKGVRKPLRWLKSSKKKDVEEGDGAESSENLAPEQAGTPPNDGEGFDEADVEPERPKAKDNKWGRMGLRKAKKSSALGSTPNLTRNAERVHFTSTPDLNKIQSDSYASTEDKVEETKKPKKFNFFNKLRMKAKKKKDVSKNVMFVRKNSLTEDKGPNDGQAPTKVGNLFDIFEPQHEDVPEEVVPQSQNSLTEDGSQKNIAKNDKDEPSSLMLDTTLENPSGEKSSHGSELSEEDEAAGNGPNVDHDPVPVSQAGTPPNGGEGVDEANVNVEPSKPKPTVPPKPTRMRTKEATAQSVAPGNTEDLPPPPTLEIGEDLPPPPTLEIGEDEITNDTPLPPPPPAEAFDSLQDQPVDDRLI